MLSKMYKICFILLFFIVSSYCDKRFRVANGETVGRLLRYEVENDGEFPYMARISSIVTGILPNGTELMKIINCGGCIIRSNVILTAAHCVINNAPEKIAVYAGLLNKKFEFYEPGLQITGVRRFVTDERFNRTFMDYDIALLFLESELLITQYVKIIDLPSALDYNLGVPAAIIGWGTDENGDSPDWLQKGYLVPFPRKLCQFHTNHSITKRMLCAVDPHHSWTVCKGDSGGPLVFNNRVIGITSWAMNSTALYDNKTACNSYLPSVFVNVLSFVPWIEKHIREDIALVG